MNEKTSNNTGAGKGDKPRNCFSKQYKDNYDLIDWNHKEDKENNKGNDKGSYKGKYKGKYK